MPISVVPMVDTVLGLALIGTAAAIHFRPRRHRRRIRHRTRVRPHRLQFRLHWLPAPLAVTGLAVMIFGWLSPGEADLGQAASTATPAASEQASSAPEDASGGLLLVRGTPTDDDSASENEVRDYSARLGKLLAGTLSRPPLALQVGAEAIDADQWTAIRDDHDKARKWCSDEPASGFVAVIAIGAVHLENGAGFAPWREPEYLIVSCTDDREVALRGRAYERLGDRIPYEQSVADELRGATSRLIASPN
jgi:hypothetical protein